MRLNNEFCRGITFYYMNMGGQVFLRVEYDLFKFLDEGNVMRLYYIGTPVHNRRRWAIQ